MVNVLGQKHLRFTLVHLFFTQSAQFFSLGFVFSPKPGGEFEDSKSRKKERAWTKREKRRVCCFHNRWLNSLPVLPCTKAEFAVETLMIGSPCTSLQTHTHTHTHTHTRLQNQAVSEFNALQWFYPISTPNLQKLTYSSALIWGQAGSPCWQADKDRRGKGYIKNKAINERVGEMITWSLDSNETSVLDVKRSSFWFSTSVINMKFK